MSTHTYTAATETYRHFCIFLQTIVNPSLPQDIDIKVPTDDTLLQDLQHSYTIS